MRLLPVTRLSERRDSLENPSIPLSSPQAYALLTGALTSDAGVSVSEYTAMCIAAVWRCVAVISGTCAQAPLHAWQGRRGDSDRKAVEVEVFENPNPEITIFDLIEMTLVHDLLWGNGYWLKIPTNAGDSVAQVWPIPPWAVRASRETSNRFGIPDPKVYELTATGKKYTDDDFIHFPALGYDGVKGLSPIAHARQSFGLSVASEKAAALLFGNGTMLGGILTTDTVLDQPKAESLKSRWRETMSGLDRAHEVAVLDSGLKFQPVSIPPEDAQFLQSRQFSVEEVCRWFGVPPHLAMLVDKTTSWGAGIAEQSIGLHRYTLAPWQKRLEHRMTKYLLPPGQYAEFDNSQLLRGDMTSRFAAYGSARSAGWASGNDIRKWEQMEPVDDPVMNEYGPVPWGPPGGVAVAAGANPKGGTTQ